MDATSNPYSTRRPNFVKIRRTIFEKSDFFDLALYDYLEFWNSKINIFEKIKIESQLIIQKNLYFIETLGPGRSYDHVGQYETVVMNSTRGNAVFGLLFPMGLVQSR